MQVQQKLDLHLSATHYKHYIIFSKKFKGTFLQNFIVSPEFEWAGCTEIELRPIKNAGFSVSGVADLHQIYNNSALNRKNDPVLLHDNKGAGRGYF